MGPTHTLPRGIRVGNTILQVIGDHDGVVTRRRVDEVLGTIDIVGMCSYLIDIDRQRVRLGCAIDEHIEQIHLTRHYAYR